MVYCQFQSAHMISRLTLFNGVEISWTTTNSQGQGTLDVYCRRSGLNPWQHRRPACRHWQTTTMSIDPWMTPLVRYKYKYISVWINIQLVQTYMYLVIKALHNFTISFFLEIVILVKQILHHFFVLLSAVLWKIELHHIMLKMFLSSLCIKIVYLLY